MPQWLRDYFVRVFRHMDYDLSFSAYYDENFTNKIKKDVEDGHGFVFCQGLLTVILPFLTAIERLFLSSWHQGDNLHLYLFVLPGHYSRLYDQHLY